MLVEAFKNPPQTREEGLYFEEKHYKCVRADKNSIYGKNVSMKDHSQFLFGDSFFGLVHSV